MARVKPLETERERRNALRKARLIFAGHALQTLGMFTTPLWAPWWVILAVFGFIYWLNVRYKGCPWTRAEVYYRRLSGWKGFPQSLIGRLITSPYNIWRPEAERWFPARKTVDTLLLGTVFVIVSWALYRQGLTPCTWAGVLLKGC